VRGIGADDVGRGDKKTKKTNVREEQKCFPKLELTTQREGERERQ